MAQFDFNGGHFAPQGYLRIDAGGSHEENPNGGVQVGVDPQGVPNMLEEDESVYNDYVYSDNIVADEEFIVKHNLPRKYIGKLYSQIADDLITEVENMPLDAVANNGLNAMLLRLAEAQEEQKAAEQQRQLEEELAQLSPEELAELESALAQEEEQAAMQEQQMPQEGMVPPEQMPAMPQDTMLQQPGMPMACGGKIRRYETGGPVDTLDLSKLAARAREIQQAEEEYYKTRDAYNTTVGNKKLRDFFVKINPFDPDRNLEQALARQSNYHKQVMTLISDEPELINNAYFLENYEKNTKQYQSTVDKAQERADRKHEKEAGIREKVFSAGQAYEKAKGRLRDVTGTLPATTSFPTVETMEDVIVPEPAAVDAETVSMPKTPMSRRDSIRAEAAKLTAGWANKKALGGPINKFETGGWADFIKQVQAYRGSNRKSIDKHYKIDPNFYKRYGFNSIKELENSEPYKAFTRYVLANSNNKDVLEYLRAIDAGVAQDNNVPMLFDENGKLKEGWEKQYINLRNDGLGGIYHFMGDWDNLDNIKTLFVKQPLSAGPAIPGVGALGQRGVGNAYLLPVGDNPNGISSTIAVNGITSTMPNVPVLGPRPGRPKSTGTAGDPSAGGDPYYTDEYEPLPTWPRYAGAVTAGLLGLHNALQEPDRYVAANPQPVLPYGRMGFIDPVYRPLDQEMAVNDVLSSGAGTTRAINNAGISPSVGATLLAQDYNTGRNLGNARANVWAANNAERNNIVAGRNQNSATQANFDYGVTRDRVGILNNFAMRNAQNNLLTQRLNYEAEAQKYAAIQQQIDNLASALAGIGTENFAMNQLNTNSALDYGVRRNGVGYYRKPKTI